MRIRLHLIAITSLVFALSCGNDPTAPPGGNGGNGNQNITVTSLASLQDWTLQEQATPRSYAFWNNGVLQSAVDIYGTGTCSSLDRSVTALHTPIDFTQYKSCRATFSVHARAHALAWTGFAQAKVVVAVRSNVPGTPNLVVLEAQA
jgi:hypothetical protein